MEQYGFRFHVDASDAAKGWGQFEAAVEGVFKALDRMESHVSKTMAAVNKNTRQAAGGVKQFAQAGKMLASIKLDGRATANINSLSAAMKGFKAPSSAQVKNLRDFFKALQIAGTGGGAAAARNIGALNSAMAGFKAPSASNVRNLRDFFTALSTFRNNGLANAAGMFASLRQISGFKAPSATQVKNLQAFLTTVANLQIPRNGAQIASVLDKIARASTVANTHLRGLRGSIGSFNWDRFNSGSRQASINMMGLQNAFSATYQIGSVLRSLLGSLTIAELGRGFFEATNRLQTFNSAMMVISKESAYAAEQLQFVSGLATRLGLDYGAATIAFSKFAISADKAGASTAQARDIFEGFSSAMSVMGLAADRQQDVMLALQQVMNKGYLAGEELNQQLNEHLPGALGYLREELKKHGMTLEDALSKKALDATQSLLFLASKYREEFGPALEKALNRPAAQMNILRTNISKLFESIANNGGNQGFVDFLKRINAYMRPEDIERYGKAIGELINRYMNKLSAAVDWLAQNWDDLKGPLATTLSLLGKWLVISGMLQIGKFLVTPIFGAVTALQTFIPVAGQAVLLMQALRASSMMGPPTALAAMNTGTLTLYQRLTGVKTTLTTMPKNPFAAMRTGVTSLSGAVPSVISNFVKLGGTIAGGLALAFAVARDENKKYASDSYSTTEIVRGFFLTLGDNITEIWTNVTNFMSEKFGWVGESISNAVSGLWNFFKEFMMNLSFGFAKVGQAIVLTFKSVFQGIARQIITIGSAIGDVFNGNFASAGSKAADFLSGKGMASAFQENFKGFLSDLPGQMGQFRANTERGYEALSNLGAYYGARARAEGKGGRSRAADRTAQEQAASLYDPDKLLREGAADGDKKGSKGRKGRTVDPAKELDRLQRAVDGMMKRLAEDNPLLKLQQDYVNDLTEQAQLLLTDGGYAKWMADLAKNGGDAEAALIDLTDALTGAGADQKVLTDLSVRYGVKVEQITGMLERQAEAYRYKREQAEIEARFGGKLLKDMDDQIRLARLGAADQKALSAVMEEVRAKREKGITLSQQEINHLYEQVRLRERYIDLLQQEREFYENNGVRTYLADLQSAGEAVHEMDKTFLQGMEDTIFRIGKEGKLSFKGLFDSIQDGLLRFASQNITKALTGMMTGGDAQNPTIFGGLFKMMGFDPGFDKAKAAERFNAQNVELYATTLNVNGNLLSGSLGSTFGTGATSGLNAAGELVVNATAADNLQQQMADAVGAGAIDGSKVLSKELGTAGRNFGGMLQSIFGSLAAGGGTGGGFFGSLLGIGMSFLGGGGITAATAARLNPGVSQMIAANPGIFAEGGYSTSPVARLSGSRSVFTNAPHYAEGTHNTTPGIPAVLHDNEAVIPLSRGRKVPVELTNGNSRGSGTVINNNWNIQTPDADSFRRSQQQVVGQMHRAAQRASMRNN